MDKSIQSVHNVVVIGVGPGTRPNQHKSRSRGYTIELQNTETGRSWRVYRTTSDVKYFIESLSKCSELGPKAIKALLNKCFKRKSESGSRTGVYDFLFHVQQIVVVSSTPCAASDYFLGFIGNYFIPGCYWRVYTVSQVEFQHNLRGEAQQLVPSKCGELVTIPEKSSLESFHKIVRYTASRL